jgi:hypothetical protein
VCPRVGADGGRAGGSTSPVDAGRALARLYGQLRDAYDWTNPTIDALTVGESDEIVEHWREQPPLAVVIRHHLGYRETAPSNEEAPARIETREVTQAQFDRIVAEHKACAASRGVRSPFA